MAVDVSKIPNNSKFDPVREAILKLQKDVTEGVAGVATVNSSDGNITITNSGNITVGTVGETITIGIDDSTYLVASDLDDYLLLTETGTQTIAGNIVISGDLTISGTTTFIDTTHLNIGDNIITLNADLPSTSAPTENAGIAIYRGSSATKTFLWNETSDKWTLGSDTLVAGTFEGNLTGNVTGNVTGSASLNVLKAGDTMTGDLELEATAPATNDTSNATPNLTFTAKAKQSDGTAVTDSVNIYADYYNIANRFTRLYIDDNVNIQGTLLMNNDILVPSGVNIDIGSNSNRINHIYTNSLTIGSTLTAPSLNVSGSYKMDNTDIITSNRDFEGRFVTSEGTNGALISLKRDDDAIVADETLGQLVFYGQDTGGTYQPAGRIKMVADDTWDATFNQESRLEFWTHNTTTEVQRLIISTETFDIRNSGLSIGGTERIEIDGDATLKNVTATSFSGDGSGLTNLPATSTTSNLQTVTSNGASTTNEVTIKNTVYSEFGSNETDINGLLSGSTFGTWIKGRESGHVVIGLRDNDTADSFAIVSGNGNYTTNDTYDKLVARFFASGNATISGNLTASSFIKSGGTSSQFLKADGSVDTNSYAEVNRASVTISKDSYTRVARVEGNNLASTIRMTVHGTTANIVVNCLLDISVNHSEDIIVHSQAGRYSSLDVKIISNNNEDFDIYLQYTGSASAGTSFSAAIEVFPLNNETITFSPTATAYTGKTFTHTATPGKIKWGQSDSDPDLYVNTSRVFHDGYHPNADKWTSPRTVTFSGDITGSFSIDGSSDVSNVDLQVSNDSHNHDGRYYTEEQSERITARALGWVPAYNTTDENAVFWNDSEQAIELYSATDTSIGMSLKAIRVKAGDKLRFTTMVKGSSNNSDGLYLRLYAHNGDMPDGKTHVSHNASNSSPYVQEDDSGETTWYENGAITTDWVTFEHTYTALADGYVSLVVLNWSGFGTGRLYVKQPDIQFEKVNQASNAGNADTLDLLDANDFTLDRVTGFGNSTNNNITVGNITSGDISASRVTPTSLLIDSGGGDSSIGQKFLYRIGNSSSAGTTWKKVCDVTLPTGNWSALSMDIVFYFPNTNFGDSASLLRYFYSASFRRSSNSQDNLNDAVLYGYNNNYIRIVKTSTGNYELQARANLNNRGFIVEYTVTGGNPSNITPTDGSVNGSTTGTVYTASTNDSTGIYSAGFVAAKKFTKEGGTQAQFLKADGSVNTLNVVTNSTASGSGALFYTASTGEFEFTPPYLDDFITDSEVSTLLNGYLPTSGGTLTGLLTTADIDAFGDVDISGDLIVDGTTFVVDATDNKVSINANPLSSARAYIFDSDSDPDSTATALHLRGVYSGTKAVAGDHIKRGIYIDLDSSASGDTSDEHMLFGIQVDARNSGLADNVTGVYSYVESNLTTQTATHLKGGQFIVATDINNSTGRHNELRGVEGSVYIQDLGGFNNAYASYNRIEVSSNRNANLGALYGGYFEIETNNPNANSYGTMFGVRSAIDNNEGTVPNIGTSYLFYGDYQGTRAATNSWGIYVQGDKHYLEGQLGIGTTSVGSYALSVNGDSSFTGDADFTGDVSANKLRLVSVSDASATSTAHAFQIGPDSSSNIIMDSNEIMARSNGVVSGLHLNPDGGEVTIHNNTTAGTVTIGGNQVIHAGNIGSQSVNYASGADTVDGLHASSFLRTDTNSWTTGYLGIGISSNSSGDFSATQPKFHVKGPDTSGSYHPVARFQAGNDSNNTGAAILINHSNDRGLAIRAGRKDSDRPVAFFDLIDSNGSTTNMITLGEYGTANFYCGIGTSSPAYKLDVSGDVNIPNAYAYKIDGTDILEHNTTYTQINNPEGATCIYLGDSADRRNYYDNNGHRFRSAGGVTTYGEWNSNGLGIGTTAPSYPLQVERTSYGVVSKISTVDGTYNPRLILYSSASGSHIQHTYSSTAANLIFEVGGSEGAGNEKMRINNSGNVGIGTTSPARKLETVSSEQVVSLFRSLSSTSARITLMDANTTNDSKVGIASSGDNFLVYANGERMRITSAGNVGIGTTSPSAKLNIYENNTSVSPLLRIENDGTGDAALNFVATGIAGWSMGLDNSDGDNFKISTDAGSVSAATKFVIDRSGNVGIGTTSPNHKVDIYSNENVPLRIHRPSNANLDSSGAWGIGFSTRGDANTSTSDTRAGIFSYYNGNLFLATGTTSIVSDPDAYARLTVTGAGNVGIGTTSPSSLLHLVGNSAAIRIEESGGAQVRMAAGGSTGYIGTYSNHELQFLINGNNAITVNTSRNVGIGTTTPSAKLEVNGTFKSAGIQDSADSLAIFINGNEEVGIGTTSPTQKLDVAGTIRSNAYEGKVKINSTATNGKQYEFISIDTGNLGLYDGTAYRLWVAGNGNIGVGTVSPSYKLDVNGTIRATGDVIAYSDARVKENVKTIDNALDKVTQLRGVSYNKIGETEEKIGVIAQEIEKVLPQVVQEDAEGMKSVAYGNIVGVLIEAIKEQQKQIDELKARLDGSTK